MTKIPNGKKSVGISITIQPKANMTSADIEAISTAVIKKINKETGATLR